MKKKQFKLDETSKSIEEKTNHTTKGPLIENNNIFDNPEFKIEMVRLEMHSLTHMRGISEEKREKGMNELVQEAKKILEEVMNNKNKIRSKL